jgi:hypothetical protein
LLGGFLTADNLLGEEDENLKNKKYIIPFVVGTIFIVLLASFFVMRIRPDGSTLKSRELQLNELSKLDGLVMFTLVMKLKSTAILSVDIAALTINTAWQYMNHKEMVNINSKRVLQEKTTN